MYGSQPGKEGIPPAVAFGAIEKMEDIGEEMT